MAYPHPQPTWWNDGPGDGGFPQLQGDLKVDAAVVGGGIVGVTAARRLSK
jgi:hypothetical protein